jgi:hypothetical protein
MKTPNQIRKKYNTVKQAFYDVCKPEDAKKVYSELFALIQQNRDLNVKFNAITYYIDKFVNADRVISTTSISSQTFVNLSLSESEKGVLERIADQIKIEE